MNDQGKRKRQLVQKFNFSWVGRHLMDDANSYIVKSSMLNVDYLSRYERLAAFVNGLCIMQRMERGGR